MHQSLLLFIALLIILTISIYFGKQSTRLNEQFIESLVDATSSPAKITPEVTLPATNSCVVTTPAVTTPVATTPTVTTPVATTTRATSKFGKFSFTLDGEDLSNLLSVFKQPSQTQNVDDNKISDYYNWLTFWNTVANSDDKDILLKTSNYTAKTAVVPTVSPRCHNCQASGSNGVCTNCGGFGGYGVSLTYKNRFSDFISTYGSGYRGQGYWSGYGGGDNSLGRLAEKSGSGIVDVTKTVANDATYLAAAAGSGAVGLLRDTGSGAVGLLRDTGSGAVSLLKTNPIQINNYQPGYNNPQQTGYYSQGTYNLPNNPLGIQGMDPYSYNGALVSKGGNYIPVTDDFSQFRK